MDILLGIEISLLYVLKSLRRIAIYWACGTIIVFALSAFNIEVDSISASFWILFFEVLIHFAFSYILFSVSYIYLKPFMSLYKFTMSEALDIISILGGNPDFLKVISEEDVYRYKMVRRTRNKRKMDEFDNEMRKKYT